jgi:hypothetical protein
MKLEAAHLAAIIEASCLLVESTSLDRRIEALKKTKGAIIA